jgi:MFS family permease
MFFSLKPWKSPTMSAAMKPGRKNYWLGILHEALWGTGFGLFVPNTIISMALVALGQTAFVVGLFNAFFFAGIYLPQAFSALGLSPRFTNPKPLAWLHIPAILGPLGAGLGFFLTPQNLIAWRLTFLFAGFTLFALGIGIVIPHWIAFIGRTIPENFRGRYFGASFFASNLCSTFSGWLATRWAVQGGLEWGYAACFFSAVPLLAASILVLTRMKPLIPKPEPPPSKALRNSFRLMKERLEKSGMFRLGILLVVLMIFTASSGSLFIVYLEKVVNVEKSWLQFFTPAMTLGGMAVAFLMGFVADHRSIRSAYGIAFLNGLAALALVFFFRGPILNSLAFACLGCTVSAFSVVNSVLVLKMAGPRESSIQTGFFNTLMGPWNFIAPLLAGWMASHFGYGWSFFLSAASAVGALCILATQKEWALKNK